MKKLFFMLFVFSMSLTYISCGNVNSPEEELTIQDQLYITVVKYSNPLYKDYILAKNESDINYGDSLFYACGLTNPERIAFTNWWNKHELSGKSPYIELVDNFLLLDWHWHPMLIYGGVDTYNANSYNAVLIENKWSELKDLNQVWSIDTPNDHNAIEKILIFKVKLLDVYRGDSGYKTNGWEKHLYHAAMFGFRGMSDSYPNGIDEYESQIDSLQQIYVECLNNILQHNDYEVVGGYVTKLK